MASGSFAVSTDNSYISGYVYWSESNSNVTANTSDVQVTLKLSRTNTGYTTTTSGQFNLSVNGTVVYGNNDTFTISYNSGTILCTGKVTVPHNADGTKSVTIGWSGSSTEVNLTSGQGTAVLSTIAQASSLSSSPSWTGGNSLPISVKRNSSSYTHDLKIEVWSSTSQSWETVTTVTSIGTSTTYTFSQSENTTLFQLLSHGSNYDEGSRLTLTTYDGGSVVGTNTYSGTVSSPNPSTTTNSGSWNIGDTVSTGLTVANSNFTHTIRYYVASTLIHTENGVTTSFDWTPTSSEITAMYNATPNSNTPDSSIQIDTFYNGVQVQTTTTQTGTATVTNSNPTFGTGFTYADTNSTTTAITQNNQYIIQNKSTITVTIPVASKATAINGATMSQYVCTLNGVQQTASYSSSTDITFNFGTISASSDVTLSCKAVDSRGNSTENTMTVNVLPYSLPIINTTAARNNGFDANTTLTMNGSISPLTISGANKNIVVNVQYRYKKTTDGSFPAWSNFTFSTSGSTYTATNAVVSLDSSLSWNVDVQVSDKFGSYIVSQVVTPGQPLFSIDTSFNSVGVNKIPTHSNAIDVAGDIYASGNSNITGNQTVTGSQTVGSLTSNGDASVSGALNVTGNATFNGTLNVKGKLGIVSDVGWQTAALVNSWTKYNTIEFPPQYYKDAQGFVHLRGCATGGAVGSTMFTLPSGYIPSMRMLCGNIGGGNAIVRIDVDNAGNVSFQAGSNTFVSLEGIKFATFG